MIETVSDTLRPGVLTAVAVMVFAPGLKEMPCASKVLPVTVASMPFTVTFDRVSVTVPFTAIEGVSTTAPSRGSVIFIPSAGRPVSIACICLYPVNQRSASPALLNLTRDFLHAIHAVPSD